MRSRSFLVFPTLLLALTCVARGQDLPKKVAVLEDASNYSKFIDLFEKFVDDLSAAPRDVRGFIALSSQPGEIMHRYKFIRQRMRQDANLKRRLEVTQPGIRYNGSWEATEFWLLPKNAASPYIRQTADYSCPTLELSGDTNIGERTVISSYSVNYPAANWLDTPFTFKWSVTGGRIINGQGTTSITVERKRKDKRPIIVSIEIGGGDDEDEYCLHTATMTTEIRPASKPLLK